MSQWKGITHLLKAPKMTMDIVGSENMSVLVNKVIISVNLGWEGEV